MSVMGVVLGFLVGTWCLYMLLQFAVSALISEGSCMGSLFFSVGVWG